MIKQTKADSTTINSDRQSTTSLPSGIWVLGFVSLLMDTSSELIHSLLPIFMTTLLGASMISVGLIEGLAEACAAITKAFSGVISDYLGKRKFLAVLGYGLAALTKPVFPLANSIGWVFMGRFVDRMGKGIRGAPRDALVADITPVRLRGAAYGLRQALDSIGALLGPLLAVLFMFWLSNNIRGVLWVAAVPAGLAVVLLVVGVHEPGRKPSEDNSAAALHFSDVKRLKLFYWQVVLLGALFQMARFSEAFLVLRAADVGLAIGFVPIVMVAMNLVYAGTAYPAGIAADKFNSRYLLMLGLGILILSDILLAAAESPIAVFIGAGCWGLHMGLTQGLFAKLVADTAPADLRGTAFGIYNVISGVTLLFASVIAGMLWSILGAPATFVGGAFFASFALAGLLFYRSSA